MLKHNTSRFIVKHGHFLTLGLDALLAYSTYQSTGLFNHNFTGIASVLPYVITIPLIGLTLIAGLSTMVMLGEKGGAVGEIYDDVITDLNNKASKEIYKKYNPKKYYSQDESEEQELVRKFTFTLGCAISLDLSSCQLTKLEYTLAKEGLPKECITNSIVKEIYQNESFNQNTHAIANLFKFALNHNSENDSPNHCFRVLKILLSISPKLTQDDQKMITQLLSKNELTNANEKVVGYMARKDIFLSLNDENQKLFLEVFTSKIKNRNELIDAINEKNATSSSKTTSNTIEEKDDATPIEIKNEPLVINELSLKNFNQFKQNCQSLYDNQSQSLNQLLDKVHELLLFKEKMLGFVKNSLASNVEIEFFLTQDIDKTIHNFNREINILHKMKHVGHPELDQNREIVLNKMSDRIDLIMEKMAEHLKALHQSLTEDLHIESEVNQKVLSSKM
jgi:hypothetical protein